MPLIDPVTMSAADPASQTAPVKTSSPIELLPNDLARIVSQVHPALLLSAYYLRFPAFVADPVPTLLNSLLPLAVVQIGYAVLCLPATGSKPLRKGKLGVAKRTGEAPMTKAFVKLLPKPLSRPFC
jgi:phosphatidylinositol glycan class F